jgi:hypothetical protein
MSVTPEYWRRCSSCKNTIQYKAKHYVCSVSTCTRKRTGYVFCSVHCWERHLPGARHRDAAAIEAIAPSFEEWQREMAEEESSAPPVTATPAGALVNNTPTTPETQARRFIVREGAKPANLSPAPPKEVLVVVSKLKAYIRARSEMNTSDAVMEVLSDKLRELCDEAIENARVAGRKTVLDRDFES